jgi:quinol monooxygenase YgiN
MHVLSYLRMEIDRNRITAYEADLEEMMRLARKTPGLLGVGVFRARGDPNVYLVLSEWESHEAMRSFLMPPATWRLSAGTSIATARAVRAAGTLASTGCVRNS